MLKGTRRGELHAVMHQRRLQYRSQKKDCHQTVIAQQVCKQKNVTSKSLTNEQAYFEKDCCDDSDDGKNDLAGRIKEPTKDQLTIDIHDV